MDNNEALKKVIRYLFQVIVRNLEAENYSDQVLARTMGALRRMNELNREELSGEQYGREVLAIWEEYDKAQP